MYFASIKPPPGFKIEISPPILFFHSVGQKKKFSITVKEDSEMLGSRKKGEYAFGWYSWFDGIHNVRSPIAISVA